MKKFPLPGLERFYLPLAAFFLLLIPFGLYLFFYVGHQERYYTHRNVRDLAVVSRQIRDQVASYQKVLQSRADYEGRRLVEGKAAAKDALIQQSLRDYIDDRVPGLSYVKPGVEAAFPRDLTLIRGNRGFELYFRAAPVKESADPDVRVYAKTSLRQFGDQFAGHGEFESILLLDGKGTVLYQSEHPELRATKIAAFGEESLTALTGVSELTLGNVDYLAFTQPIDLTVATLTGADPTARQQWVVCGLVAKDHFKSEARAISYSMVIWFVFILAMLIFLAPFLKLRFLAPTERLPRWEGPKLLVATLLGVAAVSVSILDVYYYDRLIAEVDQSLADTADRMEDNFTDEITRAYRQLAEHDRQLVSVGKHHKFSEKKSRGCGDAWPLGGILDRNEVNTEIYPYLSLIIWADAAGEQKIKWSVNKEPTTFVPVGGRDYFHRVRDHDRSIRELASLRTENGNVGNLWLESLFSWTTGSSEVVISQGVQSRDCSDSKTDPLLMVAGVFQPLSVTEPVLPRGYGFAIVDREGKVLLHSDKRRVLTENFFTESDEKRELRSAVQGRIHHTLAIRYFGQDHRAHVRPLDRFEGLDWTLIVFHPMKPLRTMNLEVLTLTSVLFGVYLLSLA